VLKNINQQVLSGIVLFPVHLFFPGLRLNKIQKIEYTVQLTTLVTKLLTKDQFYQQSMEPQQFYQEITQHKHLMTKFVSFQHFSGPNLIKLLSAYLGA
jgi:hypothetical protein